MFTLMNRRWYIYTGLLLLVATLTQAQSYDTHRLYFGLDLLRTFPLVFERGYVFEPSIIYKTNTHTTFDVAIGFNDIRKDELYGNMDYANTGQYYRVGVGQLLFKERRKFNDLNLQFALLYSDFTEKGTIVFKGDNYGDLVDIKKQRNQLFALELQPNYCLPVSDRISVNFQIRINYVVSTPKEEQFPLYYVPGAGMMQIFDDNDEGVHNSNRVTQGISIRLVYKFLEL
jgi:hypothetical protein